MLPFSISTSPLLSLCLLMTTFILLILCTGVFNSIWTFVQSNISGSQPATPPSTPLRTQTNQPNPTHFPKHPTTTLVRDAQHLYTLLAPNEATWIAIPSYATRAIHQQITTSRSTTQHTQYYITYTHFIQLITLKVISQLLFDIPNIEEVPGPLDKILDSKLQQVKAHLLQRSPHTAMAQQSFNILIYTQKNTTHMVACLVAHTIHLSSIDAAKSTLLYFQSKPTLDQFYDQHSTGQSVDSLIQDALSIHPPQEPPGPHSHEIKDTWPKRVAALIAATIFDNDDNLTIVPGPLGREEDWRGWRVLVKRG